MVGDHMGIPRTVVFLSIFIVLITFVGWASRRAGGFAVSI
jgi:hypothetical protein